MVLGGEDYIFGARVMEYPGPCLGIPVLSVTVKRGCEIVVVIVRAEVLAMIGLRGRSIDSQTVQIPLRVGIVQHIVGVGEIVLRMHERRPSRHRVQPPVNEDAQLGVGIPRRKRMLIERFESRFVVDRRLGRKSDAGYQAKQSHSGDRAGSIKFGMKYFDFHVVVFTEENEVT